MTSRLLDPKTVGTVEEAVSAHIGHTWRISSWTDLAQRASHPAMILRDESYAVFAKLAAADEATLQVNSELAGLRLLTEFGIPVPVPVGSGRVDLADGSAVLLFEALVERTHRSTEDWQAIGRVLAALHAVEGGSYGAAADGFFGPLRLENAPVDPDTWVEFYTVRRVQPWLRTARDAGSVDAATAARVETLIQRLPQLAGPDPSPRLLHGDAQHHNFLSTDTGAVVIDASPYFGHPEIDLALLDYFSPVPPQTWSAYNEIRPIDKEFQQRRELWRVFAYLGILTVDPTSEFGRTFGPRLHSALSRYL